MMIEELGSKGPIGMSVSPAKSDGSSTPEYRQSATRLRVSMAVRYPYSNNTFARVVLPRLSRMTDSSSGVARNTAPATRLAMFSIPMKVMSPSLKTSVHGFDRGGD